MIPIRAPHGLPQCFATATVAAPSSSSPPRPVDVCTVELRWAATVLLHHGRRGTVLLILSRLAPSTPVQARISQSTPAHGQCTPADQPGQREREEEPRKRREGR
uniref:Uncharacterized protein n=1 Tax=Oryza sativa subsp. japonica TaxID=39947 RepID=Q6Z430_ORYSJ|nr:hypothetical protein [Oryza sativa Japonica Group]